MYFYPIFLFLSISCSSNGQDSQDASGIAETVNVIDFEALLTEHPGTLIDVRTADEFESGKIDEAINIDWHGNTFNTEVEKLDKRKPVYVYCRSGGRSKSAMKRLTRLGFEEVYNLNGGITAWNQAHP